MIKGNFKKKIDNKKYTKAYTTSNTTSTEKLLVETITVSSYFGSDAAAFYNQHAPNGEVAIQITLEKKNHIGNLLQFEAYYRADNMKISDRKARFNDVIDVYAILLKPIEYDVFMEHTDGKFFSLDLNPTPGHFYTAAHQNGFRYIPTEVDTVTDVKERNAIELMTAPLYLYAIPQYIRDGATGEVINGTQRPRAIFHTDQSDFFNLNHRKHDQSLFLLGEVMNQNPLNLQEDVTYLDTRTRGGGIKANVTRKEIEARDKNSLHNWDIGYFDGQAYQENGVFVVQVEAERFKNMSDEEKALEKERIEQAVEKYKAFGVLPFIDYKDEVDIKIGELIPNGEFEKGKHCGYYSAARSTGTYSIFYKELGAGDNFILSLTDNATYGIRIPGFNFNKGEKYHFELKGMKENAITKTRSSGRIVIRYMDDSEEVYILDEISQEYWVVVDHEFQMKKDVDIKDVIIDINYDDRTVNGTMYYDYVSLVSLGNYDGSQEIADI